MCKGDGCCQAGMDALAGAASELLPLLGYAVPTSDTPEGERIALLTVALRQAAMTAKRSADCPLPAPKGGGTDVVLDLVQAIKRSPLAVVLEVGADFHLFVASCEECGWNPIEALLDRRSYGMRPVEEGGYGRPLLTQDGQRTSVALGQERADTLVYRWKQVLEREGR